MGGSDVFLLLERRGLEGSGLNDVFWIEDEETFIYLFIFPVDAMTRYGIFVHSVVSDEARLSGLDLSTSTAVLASLVSRTWLVSTSSKRVDENASYYR